MILTLSSELKKKLHKQLVHQTLPWLRQRLIFTSTKRKSVKAERKEQQRRIIEVDQKSKSYQARRVSPRARNTTQSKWNSFLNRNIFFGDRPRRAARIDSWTIKPLYSSEWKKLHSYQGRTESISWNKLRYDNQ